MGRTGSKQHEDELKKLISILQNEGYKVIDLKGLSPDAIAIKDNVVSAVELVGSSYNPKKKKWEKDCTVANKIRSYSMFDDVIVRVFHRKGGLSKPVSYISSGTKTEEYIKKSIYGDVV